MAYMQLDPGLSPIFFSITLNVNPKAKFDLKVYMSMKNKNPTDRSNDKSFLNVILLSLIPLETQIRIQPEGILVTVAGPKSKAAKHHLG